jgi:hypothetical protein
MTIEIRDSSSMYLFLRIKINKMWLNAFFIMLKLFKIVLIISFGRRTLWGLLYSIYLRTSQITHSICSKSG